MIAHAPRAPGVRMRWNGGGRPAVYFANPQELDVVRLHPTQKPLRLMRAIVRDFSDNSETIIDPFAGAASTLVAARMEGRSGLGWERNPEWHAAAVKRLAATCEQPELWRPSDPTQRRAKTLGFNFGNDPEAA